MADVDDMFSPAGFVVALKHGCELSVSVSSTSTRDVTVSESDLTCARCDRPIDAPIGAHARFLALNKVLNGGLCRRCDPPVGPTVPPR